MLNYSRNSPCSLLRIIQIFLYLNRCHEIPEQRNEQLQQRSDLKIRTTPALPIAIPTKMRQLPTYLRWSGKAWDRVFFSFGLRDMLSLFREVKRKKIQKHFICFKAADNRRSVTFSFVLNAVMLHLRLLESTYSEFLLCPLVNDSLLEVARIFVRLPHGKLTTALPGVVGHHSTNIHIVHSFRLKICVTLQFSWKKKKKNSGKQYSKGFHNIADRTLKIISPYLLKMTRL